MFCYWCTKVIVKTAKLAFRWKWSKCQYKFHVCGKKSLVVFQPSPKYRPQGWWVCHVWSYKFLPPYCILFCYACMTWLYHVWLSVSRWNELMQNVSGPPGSWWFFVRTSQCWQADQRIQVCRPLGESWWCCGSPRKTDADYTLVTHQKSCCVWQSQ